MLNIVEQKDLCLIKFHIINWKYFGYIPCNVSLEKDVILRTVHGKRIQGCY